MSEHGNHRSTEEMIELLLQPERGDRLDPLFLLSLCPLSPGDLVADIGCGPGYFTLPLAKFLYRGRVYALDTDAAMVAACRARVAEARLSNVEIAQCDDYAFPLPEDGVDGALASFVLHHAEDRGRFLAAIKGALRPRGWCAVLEWNPDDPEEGPPPAHRIGPAELEALARSVGFRITGTRNLNPQHYLTILRN